VIRTHLAHAVFARVGGRIDDGNGRLIARHIDRDRHSDRCFFATVGLGDEFKRHPDSPIPTDYRMLCIYDRRGQEISMMYGPELDAILKWLARFAAFGFFCALVLIVGALCFAVSRIF
jgi:hypothetical protein